jgi:1-acyl-sn-glycerol-3-phosphate acyltransferase
MGRPLRSNVLLVSNHVSWLDIMCIAGTTGAAFVSKEEVARWPVVGWLATLNETIFVARTERSAVRGQAGALREAVESSRPVALFPEGTTSGGAAVLPFRASLLAALFPAPPALRVQPIAIDYGTAAAEIAWVGDEPAGSNTKRILGRRGVFPVTLRFLDPLDPAMFPDRKALATAARDAIVAALDASAPTNDPL